MCVMLVTAGLMLCLTILGIPVVGLTMIALGLRYVSLPTRHWH
jgi:hypothetical protein